ncbi:MAG TPA: phage holin family protein [Chitinophagales bacterium]|nr:phage holin family protein [Chitinophagales bacterium]
MEPLREKGGRALESLVSYVELRMRLLALKSADKSSRVASGFLTIVILVLIFIFSMVLLSIGTAVLISRGLDKAWAGYFIVAGIYILAGIVLVKMRKRFIFEPLLNSIVHSLLGAELEAEDKIENIQDKIEDKLNLEKQPD